MIGWSAARDALMGGRFRPVVPRPRLGLHRAPSQPADRHRSRPVRVVGAVPFGFACGSFAGRGRTSTTAGPVLVQFRRCQWCVLARARPCGLIKLPSFRSPSKRLASVMASSRRHSSEPPGRRRRSSAPGVVDGPGSQFQRQRPATHLDGLEVLQAGRQRDGAGTTWSAGTKAPVSSSTPMQHVEGMRAYGLIGLPRSDRYPIPDRASPMPSRPERLRLTVADTDRPTRCRGRTGGSPGSLNSSVIRQAPKLSADLLAQGFVQSMQQPAIAVLDLAGEVN